MSINVNQIIMESIKNEETLTESDEIQDLQETEVDEEVESYFDPAVASAISAGLGAVTLRNKLSSINEFDDETYDKAAEYGRKVFNKAKDKLSDIGDSASHHAKRIAQTFRRATDNESLGDKVSRFGRKASKYAAENPDKVRNAKIAGGAAAAGVAAGGLAGHLARRRRK